jgi:iron complex outermembrane receptor protein
MSFKLKSMPLAVSLALASGALSMAAANTAMAQAADAAAPQRVVVTGSLISRADLETAAPVQVLTAQDIQRSGKTSVAELLTDLAANGAGTLGTGFSGAFANGASGISLRGLTVGSTLVLIDGHRMSPYAIGDDSQRSFVDVSNIPFDAIDSIEILKSGASSLYGSDAVAGVVNIKLKRSFNGTRISADAGDTQHGGGATHRASLSTGIGDIDTDGYNAFATVEWRHQGAIKVSDRTQFDWDNADWRSRGGNDLRFGVPTARIGNLVAASSPFLYTPTGTNPADNPANFTFLDPNCNFVKYRAGGCEVKDNVGNIQPETNNINLLVGMTKKLNADWELAFKGSVFQRDNHSNRGLGALYNPTSFAGYSIINGNVIQPGIGAVANTTFAPGAQVGANVTNPYTTAARLYGYIPGVGAGSAQDNKATTTRFALDLHGSAYGWDVSAAGGITKSKADVDYSGYINRAALYSLINSGQWNVLGGNSAALVNQVAPVYSNSLESSLNYFDLTGSRELMQLGAGPLALAAGVHWHKRTWDAPPASLTQTGTVANTSAFVFGDETNSAVFGELQATPIKSVEVHVSSRYDHFDNNNSFTPAATIKWQPVKEFALRGTFARGFRNPNPAETGNSGSFFSSNGVDDPILCASGNPKAAGTPVTGACAITPTYVQRPNPNLSPEKSKSYTLGLVAEPVKGLTATVDYYQIKVNNEIVTATGNDPSYVPTFIRGPALPVDVYTGVGNNTVVATPAVGPVLFAESQYINAGSTKTSGIEADLGYRWRMPADLGTLRASVSAAHTFSYEQTVAGVTYQLAGTNGPSVISGATGSPKDRAQFSLDWTRGPLDITATVNYTGSFSALDPAGGADDCATAAASITGRAYFTGPTQPEFYCHIASFTATNLNVQYKLSENLTLRGAILNVFDKQPPLDPNTYGNSTLQTAYNASLHQAGAIGRFFSLGLAYTF